MVNELILDVLRSPSRQFCACGLRKTDSSLEIVDAQSCIDSLEGLNYVKPDRLVTALERHIQVELKVIAIEVLDLAWQLFALVTLVAAAEKQMSNEIKEDKDTCSSTESDVKTFFLKLESSTHWSFDVVWVLQVHHGSNLFAVFCLLFSTNLSAMDTRGESFLSVVGLESQVDQVCVLSFQEHVIKSGLPPFLLALG